MSFVLEEERQLVNREKDLIDIERTRDEPYGERCVRHGVYRHFKGGLYVLEEIAYDADTQGRVVLYRALYGEHRLWARSFEDFFAELDRAKYPQAQQKYRFELQDLG